MKNREILFAALALLIAGRATCLSESVSLTPVRDATIFSEDAVFASATADGKGGTFSVGSIDLSTVRRALIAFSTRDKVPQGSKVTGARMKIKMKQSSLGAFLTVFRLAGGAWPAGSTIGIRDARGEPAKDGDVTWLFRNYSLLEAGRVAWRTPGGDFDSRNVLFEGNGQVDSSGFLTVSGGTFTADVQSLVDAPDSHFGWILIGGETLGGSVQIFHSSEDSKAENRPVLEVDYEKRADFLKFVDGYDTLVTVAGAGLVSDEGNDWRARMEGRSALSAELSRPNTAREDYEGGIIIADTSAHAIRRVGTDGIIRTLAGTNERGFNGDGPATTVKLDGPNGLAVLRDGTIYLIDAGNRRLRRLGTDGALSTVFQDPELEGGGLWVSANADLIYYACATKLKRWTAAEGSKVVNQEFRHLAYFDIQPASGDIIAADRGAVFRVNPDTGAKRRIAGGGTFYTGDRPATDLRLNDPRGIAVLGNGGFFVSEVDEGYIWYVDPEGLVHRLIAGQGAGNYRGGEGKSLKTIVESAAWLISEPRNITIGPSGSIVITTNDSGLVRVVRRSAGPTSPNIQASRDGIRFTWKALAGRSYVIEGTTDLRQWATLGEITSSGEDGSFLDDATKGKPLRFYRVRLFP